MLPSTQQEPSLTSLPTKSKLTLIVVEGFGDYRRGDSITDPDTIKKVLESDNHDKVNKINPIKEDK